MGKFVILTYGNYPNGEAVSVRMHAFAKILQSLGYEVILISMSRTKPYVWNTYDGIKYISIRSENNDLFSRIKNVMLYKNRAKSILNKLDDVRVIMPLALTISTMLYCKKYAKMNGAKLLTDCTEWYSPSEFRLGRLSRTYILNDITNKVIIDREWRVVSISRYFEQFYKSKGIRTTRIPAIMDVEKLENKPYVPNTIRKIVYAGSPAKKDSLFMILKAFSLVNAEIRDKIQFHIYGVNKEYYLEYGDLDSLPNNIFFYGRVSRDEVLSALQSADFTTLFRDDKERFSKAGFPSKVAESFSMGVPMITNYTSDLELYLIDKENSVIIEEYSVDSYKKAIDRVSSFSDEDLVALHENAGKTARKFFDYRNYCHNVEKLLVD